MEESLDDFVDGHFFAGDLYIDNAMACYKRLDLGKGSMRSLTLSVFGRGTDAKTIAAIQLAGKIPGNFKSGLSHGTQLGATYVANVTGSTVMEHRQESFGDYVENEDIKKSLGIVEDK